MNTSKYFISVAKSKHIPCAGQLPMTTLLYFKNKRDTESGIGSRYFEDNDEGFAEAKELLKSAYLKLSSIDKILWAFTLCIYRVGPKLKDELVYSDNNLDDEFKDCDGFDDYY